MLGGSFLGVASGQAWFRATLEEDLGMFPEKPVLAILMGFNKSFIFATTHSIHSLRNQNNLGKLLI